ncbi:MAG: efflux RND transporter periplasmic adaptor subunit [Halobacteriovoraceae bacterium]|nr:efflux RND transporter periplasmic adaptor subunit [Halobacteriovoraceae bacterium]
MHKKIWGIFVITLSLLATIFLIFNQKNFSYLDLKEGKVIEAVYGLGQVKSDQIFEVKIGILTNVLDLFVKEGQFIEKGSNIISFEGGSTFQAPFEGTITYVGLQKGEIATPQIPIIRLENLNQKYIEVSLEQEAALKVRKGQKAKVLFESLRKDEFEGNVSTIFPKNGEFVAHITIKNLTDNILPGMTADIVIQVGEKDKALLIPIKAISAGRVTRLRDTKKSKIDVKIGHSDGLWGELLEGDLKLGDQLVLKGRN